MSTPDALYEEAIALRNQGDKQGAVEKLKEALTIDPDFTLGHGLAARLYADLAMADEAIRHAERVVELEPNDTFSYTALSVIYQRCGRIPEAEEAMARANSMQMGFGP